MRVTGAIDDGVLFGDTAALVSESPQVTLQRMTSRTEVAVGLGLPGEVGSTELAGFAIRFIPHWDMRRDVLVIHQPRQHRRTAVGGITD